MEQRDLAEPLSVGGAGWRAGWWLRNAAGVSAGHAERAAQRDKERLQKHWRRHAANNLAGKPGGAVCRCVCCPTALMKGIYYFALYPYSHIECNYAQSISTHTLQHEICIMICHNK